ncbi:unnamed protein product [Lymnaea stagnalis]|uniref:C-type lectin domain-containing protein n=1 Tax=Lymnaea stagnalis TaxID=6523 RepID=A0AAV2H0C6_LYMST
MTYKLIKLFLIYFLLATFRGLETRVTTLIKIVATDVVLDQNEQTIHEVNLAGCAFRCRNSQEKCCSFYYNRQARECTLGFWLLPSTKPRDQMTDLFTVGTSFNTSDALGPCRGTSDFGMTENVEPDVKMHRNFCNTSANFTVLRLGSTSVCIWISSKNSSYIAAKPDCIAKGANLYTFKTVDKTRIFLNISDSYVSDFWLGLDDMQQETVFRWADDDSITNVTNLNIPFKDILMRNYNADCIAYIRDNKTIDDLGCTEGKRYICEMNPQCS